MASDTRPAIFLLRRCDKHRRRTWHLTTGLKDDPRICADCLAGVPVPEPPQKKKGAA